MRELEDSHRELCAALEVAIARIRKLTFGRKEDPSLASLEAAARRAKVVRTGGNKSQIAEVADAT